MKEVKLIVDGKEYKLTDEQMDLLKLLGSCDTKEEKCKLFDRVYDDEFFVITEKGRVCPDKELFEGYVNDCYLVANYCKDKDIMTKRAKQEVLSRLLWKFSWENGWDDALLDDTYSGKYSIVYDFIDRIYHVYLSKTENTISDVYFISEDIAQKAIREIVIPFQKGELPVCKLWDK